MTVDAAPLKFKHKPTIAEAERNLKGTQFIGKLLWGMGDWRVYDGNRTVILSDTEFQRCYEPVKSDVAKKA